MFAAILLASSFVSVFAVRVGRSS